MEGIDVTKLDAGTKLEINTANSTYNFEVTSKERYLLCQGGKYFPEKKKVFVTNRLIEYGKRINIFTGKTKSVTTSPVKTAKIIGENWEYQMDWG